MACTCSSPKKKIFYAYIELRTKQTDGILGGYAPPPGSVKEVTVCTECGAAEFTIPDDERRAFRVG
jgi:hypothetical protein